MELVAEAIKQGSDASAAALVLLGAAASAWLLDRLVHWTIRIRDVRRGNGVETNARIEALQRSTSELLAAIETVQRGQAASLEVTRDNGAKLDELNTRTAVIEKLVELQR